MNAKKIPLFLAAALMTVSMGAFAQESVPTQSTAAEVTAAEKMAVTITSDELEIPAKLFTVYVKEDGMLALVDENGNEYTDIKLCQEAADQEGQCVMFALTPSQESIPWENVEK